MQLKYTSETKQERITVSYHPTQRNGPTNSSHRKWQDYVYIQCEYKGTKQKIKHLLREENKVNLSLRKRLIQLLRLLMEYTDQIQCRQEDNITQPTDHGAHSSTRFQWDWEDMPAPWG